MKYKIGKQSSKRVVKRFLLLPKTLPVNNRDGEIEVRWLERVSICQWLGCSGTWWDGFFIE
jgi:Rieske Fe-S protein